MGANEFVPFRSHGDFMAAAKNLPWNQQELGA
jgi:hypothetical protein